MTAPTFSQPDIGRMTKRLVKLWLSLPEDTKADGRRWYPAAYTWAADLAAEYGTPMSKVVGVIAALSPQIPWTYNLQLARSAVIAHRYGRRVTGNFRHVCEQAERILSGEPPTVVLTGPKQSAFYRAIMGEQVPVIDRWSWRAATGTEPHPISKRQYQAVEQAFYQAAIILAQPAAEVQAAIWIATRGKGE